MQYTFHSLTCTIAIVHIIMAFEVASKDYFIFSTNQDFPKYDHSQDGIKS